MSKSRHDIKQLSLLAIIAIFWPALTCFGSYSDLIYLDDPAYYSDSGVLSAESQHDDQLSIETKFTDAITIEGWVKSSFYGSLSNFKILSLQNQFDLSANSCSISLKDGVIDINLHNNSSSMRFGSNSSLDDSLWHFFAVIITRDTVKLYIDGNTDSPQIYMRHNCWPQKSLNSISIGDSSGYQNSDGAKLKHIAVFDRALPLSRIQAHWAAAGDIAPVAVARSEKIIYYIDSPDESAIVHLDAEESQCFDGYSIVSAKWLEAGQIIASGIKADARLKIGKHIITLSIKDDGGNTSTDTITINVVNPDPKAPVINIEPTVTIIDSDSDGFESVNFDISDKIETDKQIISAVWLNGPTQLASGMSPAIVCPVGTSLITLSVTDNNYLNTTKEIIVEVLPKAQNGDYYINPQSGDNANSGSKNAPWQTIQHALANISGGDTINLASGSYGSVIIDTEQSNTAKSWDNPITIRADKENKSPVILNRLAITGNYNKAFINISGLSFSETEPGKPAGIYCSRISELRILDCAIQSAIMASAEFPAAITVDNCRNVTIDGCTISESEYKGIIVRDCDDIAIKSCNFSLLADTAIHCRNTMELLIERCKISSQLPSGKATISAITALGCQSEISANIINSFGTLAAICIYPQGPDNTSKIANNLIYDNNCADIRIDTVDAPTQLINNTASRADIYAGMGGKLEFLSICNNIFTDTLSVYLENDQSLRDIEKIYNSTNILSALRVNHNGKNVYKAAFGQLDSNIILIDSSGSYKKGFDHNFLMPGVGAVFAQNSENAPPFSLRENSPAISMADPYTASKTDLLGRGRDSQPDCGAIEFINDTITADANSDGKVDSADYDIVKINFGRIDAKSPADGDFNADGKVNMEDFILLRQNYGIEK